MSDVNETLKERNSTHGDYTVHARITQDLMRVMVAGPNWLTLKDTQRESLHMIAHKIGRILAGDPDHIDSWHDIAGYSVLIENELKKDN